MTIEKIRVPDPLSEFREVFGTLRYKEPNVAIILASLGFDCDPDEPTKIREFRGWCRVAWDRTAIQVRGFRKHTTFRLCSLSQVVEFVPETPKQVAR